MKQIKLMLGDNMESLKKLPDNSIDSVVTDAPYGLGKEQDMNIVLKDWIEKGYSEIKGKGFMGKEWDAYVPQPLFWKEVYRVLKPGGHVLSFFGTRTYDIGTMAMRLAGFEIRDQIMWIYGSGFPKSHNIGKNIDKKNGDERKVVGRKIQRVDGTLRKVGATGAPFVDKDGKSFSKPTDGYIDIEEPGSETSKKWEGWGTALKPANEPICLARKPLSEKTIVDNVIKWGTGGINVDGCRIEIEGKDDRSAGIRTANFGSMDYQSGGNGTEPYTPDEGGRFPANILFDEEAAQVLDEQSGVSKSTGSTRKKENEYEGTSYKGKNELGKSSNPYAGQSGGASRFFYVAKVSKTERNMSGTCSHPTLKPINLMTYLCRLITPVGGIILDPFMGSGSTGISACLEGFRFVGMELDEDYFKIAEARVNNFEEYRKLLK
jgi:site-specific DNA-methyltransferase (adenine-specific)